MSTQTLGNWYSSTLSAYFASGENNLYINNLSDCPICKGTMHLESGDDCRNCLNGKVGIYVIPEQGIEESDIESEEKTENSLEN